MEMKLSFECWDELPYDDVIRGRVGNGGRMGEVAHQWLRDGRGNRVGKSPESGDENQRNSRGNLAITDSTGDISRNQYSRNCGGNTGVA